MPRVTHLFHITPSKICDSAFLTKMKSRDHLNRVFACSPDICRDPYPGLSMFNLFGVFLLPISQTQTFTLSPLHPLSPTIPHSQKNLIIPRQTF